MQLNAFGRRGHHFPTMVGIQRFFIERTTMNGTQVFRSMASRTDLEIFRINFLLALFLLLFRTVIVLKPDIPGLVENKGRNMRTSHTCDERQGQQ